MGGGGLAHRPRLRQDAVLQPISPFQAGSGCAPAVPLQGAAQPGAVVAPMVHEAPAAGSVPHAELSQRIEQARALATEVRDAVDAVRLGGRGDVEGVLRATRQADAAFRMVQAVCNEMLETYAQMERTRA